MVGVTDGEALADQRRRIDAVDAAIVSLLAERMDIVAEVVAIKREAGLAARLDDRVEAVVRHVRARAERAGCPPDLAEAVWRTVIGWTIAHEEQALKSDGEQ